MTPSHVVSFLAVAVIIYTTIKTVYTVSNMKKSKPLTYIDGYIQIQNVLLIMLRVNIDRYCAVFTSWLYVYKVLKAKTQTHIEFTDFYS